MTTLTTTEASADGARLVDYDAIVVGSGFGGIYALHKLRNEQGLTVRAFEKGGGIGGTWYFNRYPGAKSDTEGFVYRYSFDKDLLQDYDCRFSSEMALSQITCRLNVACDTCVCD